MTRIVAIYGSPRRNGNTSMLLRSAVSAARDEGAVVEEFVLRDLRISPCLEIYACKEKGECAIQDDFQRVARSMLNAQGIMLASPIFFYTVSAHTKAFMDRCQSLWVKRYWIDRIPFGIRHYAKKGLFVSVGATTGKRLFDGTLLTVRYFFDAVDTELWGTLLYRELDLEGDVLKHPDYLTSAYLKGREMAMTLKEADSG
jgi:multimeric flavodoxin WrbA